MLDWFRNTFSNRKRYKTHSEAVIIACFYNPLNSPYRLLAFQKWYSRIKHLNHRIIECLIGQDAKAQLPSNQNITRLRTESLLWHKEALLNKIIKDLPSEFKYVFWLDADVIFTNSNWLPESVEQLQSANIIQPFEYCVHLDRNQVEPSFNVEALRPSLLDRTRPGNPSNRLWRSFCANISNGLAKDTVYDRHGHVGLAWGARREILDQMPLYDRALIGGADHVMAHAAAGHIPHECITKAFTENLAEIERWSRNFFRLVEGKISFTRGDLYHIWHGDIQNRQYLKRIQDFTPQTKGIQEKDAHGLYVKAGNNQYMEQYYRRREVVDDGRGFNGFDDGFDAEMGYSLGSMLNYWNTLRPASEVTSEPIRLDRNLPPPKVLTKVVNRNASPTSAWTGSRVEPSRNDFDPDDETGPIPAGNIVQDILHIVQSSGGSSSEPDLPAENYS